MRKPVPSTDTNQSFPASFSRLCFEWSEKETEIRLTEENTRLFAFGWPSTYYIILKGCDSTDKNSTDKYFRNVFSSTLPASPLSTVSFAYVLRSISAQSICETCTFLSTVEYGNFWAEVDGNCYGTPMTKGLPEPPVRHYDRPIIIAVDDHHSCLKDELLISWHSALPLAFGGGMVPCSAAMWCVNDFLHWAEHELFLLWKELVKNKFFYLSQNYRNIIETLS